MSYHHRHTKIVATLGPATDSESVLESLIKEGVSIFRLNMAHANHDWVREVTKRVQKVSESLGEHVATMMDVKGPEIRTGDIEGTWTLDKGDRIRFLATGFTSCGLDKQEERAVAVNYPAIIRDVHEGDTILVDNGLIQLKIISVNDESFLGEVTTPGTMGSRRHINLPGIEINLPAITEKDRNDIAVGIEAGVDFFALSFVRKAQDVQELRNHLNANNSPAKIIAKLEDQSAVKNLESIVETSDAIMVARGDLGIECPFEQIPMIQHQIVHCCIAHSKPVIVATHMLESMISAPVPTRAEVSDVANAIFEQADAIMLSGETSVGKYPIECVQAMTKIAREVEQTAEKDYVDFVELTTPRAKMARSALILAHELNNAPIVVFSKSGNLPQILSSLRPNHCPIYAFTEHAQSCRYMALSWGLEPFIQPFHSNPEQTMEEALGKLKQENLVKPGQWIIAITGVLVRDKFVDSIQLRIVD